MFAWVKKLLRGPTATFSPYHEAVFRLEKIKPPTASVYGDFQLIQVIAPSIDIYIQIINEAISALEDSRLFRTTNFDLTVRNVSKASFYINHDGCYLDVSVEYHIFISGIKRLLELYERMSNELDQSGLQQSNLFRILPVINNVITLSVALSEDSLQ